jgi:hypothetical protein
MDFDEKNKIHENEGPLERVHPPCTLFCLRPLLEIEGGYL